MSIKLSKDTVGIWYIQISTLVDFLCSVTYIPEDEQYEIASRFRYYNQEDPENNAFSNKDRKSWFHARSEKRESKEYTLRSVRKIMKELSDECGQQVTELLMENEDVEGFSKKLRELPFAHSETITPEEFERRYGYKPNV